MKTEKILNALMNCGNKIWVEKDEDKGIYSCWLYDDNDTSIQANINTDTEQIEYLIYTERNDEFIKIDIDIVIQFKDFCEAIAEGYEVL